LPANLAIVLVNILSDFSCAILCDWRAPFCLAILKGFDVIILDLPIIVSPALEGDLKNFNFSLTRFPF
jgi:hypothetical protein